MSSKYKCDCGKIATWCYMPVYSDASNPDFCDECVHRGCSCNEYSTVEYYYDDIVKNRPNGKEGIDWEWVEYQILWRDLDNGKQLPCCEYMYDEKGWEQ